jgi:hypothetical protein
MRYGEFFIVDLVWRIYWIGMGIPYLIGGKMVGIIMVRRSSINDSTGEFYLT